jgi:hypothetical protein
VTTTDALFAGKVQRKVSNGVAQLAAARSSLDRQKIAQVLPCQQFTNARADIPAEILARGLSCVSQTWQLTREESPWREFARIPGNLRDLSKG